MMWMRNKYSREKVGAESKEGRFISLHLLGSKFFAVKYLLISTFLSFSTIETYWMLWCGHQRPICLSLIVGMDIWSYIESFC